jgi:hypothetical protein
VITAGTLWHDTSQSLAPSAPIPGLGGIVLENDTASAAIFQVLGKGGYVPVTLNGDYLYWIQASLLTDHDVLGSELMQYDFATRRTRVLFNGLVTAFTPYLDQVLFAGASAQAEVSSGNNPVVETMHALDPVSDQELPAPPGLDIGDDQPFQIVTNGDLVIWDDPSNEGLHAWRAEWG